ncbi:helix-turn-helix domain-containing protein [Actinospica robiniae]|uniref:helix-turn-helix domain-containing protein n=1 Tax=Actinospica robiniae TaxID=304901 RepID=UPI0003F8C1E6|nr:XRE family transcriptional regulator [Actinospica robiniae]
MSEESAPKPPLAAIAAALRRIREAAGMTLTELARRAGVAKSTLSQLESGQGNPSLETLWALCGALGVPVSSLLDPPRPRVQVIRAGDGVGTVVAAEADYRAILLAACPPTARRDIYRIDAEPGRGRRSDPHMPGAVEHVVLMTGRALVGLTDDPVELAPGDYVVYPGDLPHLFEALDPGTQAVLLQDLT